MQKSQPEIITMDEALRESAGRAPTIKEIQANYQQIVEEVEAKYGPHVSSIYLHILPKKGRPKAGDIVEPVQTKSVKMPPAFWADLQGAAREHGLTMHAAIRTALMEWVTKNHAK
jgi:hypothetical protein